MTLLKPDFISSTNLALGRKMRAQTQFVGEMSCTIYLIRTIVTTYHSYRILMNSIVYFENVVSSLLLQSCYLML